MDLEEVMGLQELEQRKNEIIFLKKQVSQSLVQDGKNLLVEQV